MSDKKPIVLKSLSIEREWGGEGYEGRVRFENEQGDITVKLTADKLQRVLELVADEIVAQTKEVADTLRADTITQTKPLLTQVEE